MWFSFLCDYSGSIQKNCRFSFNGALTLSALILFLCLPQISFAQELEITWTSDWSGGQQYPSPGPAIYDIHYASGTGWPGSELAIPCPEGDLFYTNQITHKYCVKPTWIPKDLSENGLLYKGNRGFAWITNCGICPVYDEFGYQRCGPSETFWCGSEGSVLSEINTHYANRTEVCSFNFLSATGWTNTSGSAAGTLPDGTALYATESRATWYYELEGVRPWPLYSTCDDPTVYQVDSWSILSVAYKACPTGYYDVGTVPPEGPSCSNHFQAILKQYGAPK